MKYRTLGKTKLKISEMGHGTWAMGFMWGPRDDGQALAALKKGLERGINFIDTAYLYGDGHSEKLIGQVLKETGAKATVASKCPPNIKSWPPKPGTTAQEAFSGDYLTRMTELSLKNLGTEVLDLQQLHVWRPEWLDQGDWLEAVDRLKSQGKIHYFGVSLNDHDPDSGLELVKSGLVDTIQVIFNLFDQNPRKKLFPLCEENNVGVIVRVPLDEGGLSGKLTPGTEFIKGDWRAKYYFKGDRLRETWERAQKFSFLVQGEIKSLAQAALKFCLSEPAVSTVLAGMRRIEHVEENIRVSELPEFSPEALQRAHNLAWPRNYYPQWGW